MHRLYIKTTFVGCEKCYKIFVYWQEVEIIGNLNFLSPSLNTSQEKYLKQEMHSFNIIITT